LPADLGRFAVSLIQSLGGRPTPGGEKLFRSWQQREGGWTNNAARFNPLNLTAPGSGLPTINSVGVVALPSMQAGVQRTSRLLRSGYPALAQALATGQYDIGDPKLQADFNRWLSGKRTPGVTPYVRGIAESLGAPVPVGAGSTGRGSPIPPPSPLPSQAPTFKTEYDPALFSQKILNQFAKSGRINLLNLPTMQARSLVTRPVPLPPQAIAHAAKAQTGYGPVDPAQPVLTGKGIALPWHYKSTHVTDGLTNEGFTRAIDIMGNPGTPVRSPAAGTVLYFHPTGAQGGGSMMVRFADGREGWIGHIANGLPAGAKIKAGTELAVISADHPRPHVHWDLR
jgi:hypothetical protein